MRATDAVQREVGVPAVGGELGVLQRPAASASRTSVDRCGRLRAECRPPTIANAGW